MSRRCRPALLLLACCLLSACVVVGGGSAGVAGTAAAPAPQEPPTAGQDSSAEERIARAVFDRVNAEREARDLAPLAWNDALAEVAREWSADMAGRDRFEHQDLAPLLRSDDRLSGFGALGENIFRATGPVPAGTIHTGWMRSDDHRVNVLNPGWNRLGIGVHCAEDGSVWATQEFGRTVDADRPAVASTTPPVEPVVRSGDDGPSCG